MSLLQKYDTKQLQALIGVFASIVVLYRFVFIMMPMFKEGYKQKDYSKMLKSLSLLV